VTEAEFRQLLDARPGPGVFLLPGFPLARPVTVEHSDEREIAVRLPPLRRLVVEGRPVRR
jgi:hypothetical protein